MTQCVRWSTDRVQKPVLETRVKTSLKTSAEEQGGGRGAVGGLIGVAGGGHGGVADVHTSQAHSHHTEQAQKPTLSIPRSTVPALALCYPSFDPYRDKPGTPKASSKEEDTKEKDTKENINGNRQNSKSHSKEWNGNPESSQSNQGESKDGFATADDGTANTNSVRPQ